MSLREQLDKAYEAALMGGDEAASLRGEELKQMEQEIAILNEAVDSLQVAVEAERSRCQELQQQLAKKTRELIRVQGELDRLKGTPRDGHLAGGSQYSVGGESSRAGSVYGGSHVSVGGASQASSRPQPTEEQLANARRILEAGRAAADRSAGARAAGAGGAAAPFVAAAAGLPAGLRPNGGAMLAGGGARFQQHQQAPAPAYTPAAASGGGGAGLTSSGSYGKLGPLPKFNAKDLQTPDEERDTGIPI